MMNSGDQQEEQQQHVHSTTNDTLAPQNPESLSKLTTAPATLPRALTLIPNLKSLCPIKLDEHNYLLWKKQIITVLDSNGFLELIDGSGRAPTVAKSYWNAISGTIFKCLVSTLEPSVAAQVGHLTSPLDLWLFLEKKFTSPTSRTNNADPPEIRCQICGKQGRSAADCTAASSSQGNNRVNYSTVDRLFDSGVTHHVTSGLHDMPMQRLCSGNGNVSGRGILPTPLESTPKASLVLMDEPGIASGPQVQSLLLQKHRPNLESGNQNAVNYVVLPQHEVDAYPIPITNLPQVPLADNGVPQQGMSGPGDPLNQTQIRAPYCNSGRGLKRKLSSKPSQTVNNGSISTSRHLASAGQEPSYYDESLNMLASYHQQFHHGDAFQGNLPRRNIHPQHPQLPIQPLRPGQRPHLQIPQPGRQRPCLPLPPLAPFTIPRGIGGGPGMSMPRLSPSSSVSRQNVRFNDNSASVENNIYAGQAGGFVQNNVMCNIGNQYNYPNTQTVHGSGGGPGSVPPHLLHSSNVSRQNVRFNDNSASVENNSSAGQGAFVQNNIMCNAGSQYNHSNTQTAHRIGGGPGSSQPCLLHSSNVSGQDVMFNDNEASVDNRLYAGVEGFVQTNVIANLGNQYNHRNIQTVHAIGGGPGSSASPPLHPSHVSGQNVRFSNNRSLHENDIPAGQGRFVQDHIICNIGSQFNYGNIQTGQGMRNVQQPNAPPAREDAR